MLLKRVYEDGRCTKVEIKHTGFDREQNFSTRLVSGAMAEGWMRMDDKYIYIKTTEEELVYKINKRPGYYCCFDDKYFESVDMVKSWVESNYKDKESPDPQNPLGYKKLNHYECVLEAHQHEKYKANKENNSPGFMKKLKELIYG